MRFIQILLLTFYLVFISACAFTNPTVDISHAARYENTKYLQEYIDKGVDINFQDDTGETPLTSAAFFGNTENIKLLLAKGADVNLRTKDGTTVITAFDQSEPLNQEVVELLLAHGVNINDADNKGETSLMKAVYYGNTENVKLLLAKGADVHLRAKDGSTAITTLSQIKPVNREVVKLLLAHGANINDTDNDDGNLLAWAFAFNEVNDSRLGDIAFFLQQGFNANAKGKNGTPIFWEICDLDEKEDFKSLIDVFLDAGVDLNLKDAEDDNLLVLRSCQKKEQIYDYLVSKGAE